MIELKIVKSTKACFKTIFYLGQRSLILGLSNSNYDFYFRLISQESNEGRKVIGTKFISVMLS